MAGITKRVSAHTLRHTFATHMLENNANIRDIQEILGHKYLETTKIYLHVMRKPTERFHSPLDQLMQNMQTAVAEIAAPDKPPCLEPLKI